MLNESVNDLAALKFVFLAGGPGAGKSYVANQLFGIEDGKSFGASGMKMVSLDLIFEKALEKLGYSKDLTTLPKHEFNKLTSQSSGSLRQKCRDLMKKQLALYAKQGIGIVFDGTGNVPYSYFNRKEDMEDMGYDTYLLFVDTPVDTALKRNAKRDRKLPDNVVRDIHKLMEYNKKTYQDMFGDDMIMVNNDDGEGVTKELRNIINDILTEPIRNPIGQKWLASGGTMNRQLRPRPVISPMTVTTSDKNGKKSVTYQPSLFPVQNKRYDSPYLDDYSLDDSPYLDNSPYLNPKKNSSKFSTSDYMNSFNDFDNNGNPWSTKPKEKANSDKFKTQTPSKQASQGGFPIPTIEKENPTNIKKSIMHQTIRNPDTGNDILIKTALGYSPDHNVFKAAQALMNKHNTKEQMVNRIANLITESIIANTAIDYLSNIIKNSPFEGKVFVAGGYVRDELMGKPSKDVDLVVTEPDGGIKFAEWLTKKLGVYSDSNPVTFPRFGTAKFNLRGVTYKGIDLGDLDIEAVMTRAETYTDGSRKPDVTHATLKQDAERRDFTVNSLMKDLTTGKILDLTGMGINDIKAGVVRSSIDPNLIFAEDPLRMLRAIRFAVKYGWKLPKNMIDAIKKNAPMIKNISSERIQDEFNKMLLTERPAQAVRLMQIVGLTDHIMPELNKLVKLKQNKYHKDDAFKHSLEVLSKVPPDLKTRIAALFHDIGKAPTKTIVDNEVHFYNHEDVGAEIAGEILKRLKYPNEMIDAITTGIKNHMRLKQGGVDGSMITDKALRKLSADLGSHLEMTLNVMDADNRSHASGATLDQQIPNVRSRLQNMPEPTAKIVLPINGNEVMTALNIKPGPLVKILLDVVKDAYFGNPKLTKDQSIDIVTDLYNDLKNRAQEIISNSSKLSDHTPERIRNPLTDNDILIKSAMSYDKEHPARKAAEELREKIKKVPQ